MKKGYFILRWGDDGLNCQVVPSKEKLLSMINGTGDFGSELTGDHNANFISELSGGILWADGRKWNDLLIIKGEIVVPQPQQVVKTYEIE